MIYADNAATTKMSEAAVKTMVDLIGTTYGNPSSLYQFGQEAKEVLEQARADVAEAIGASVKEIIFTSGGSEADNQALISAAAIGAQVVTFDSTIIENEIPNIKEGRKNSSYFSSFRYLSVRYMQA